MAQGGPGKSECEGIGLVDLLRMFPNDDTAHESFESRFWPEGPYCPYCGSVNVQSGIKHMTMTHRCRDCPDRRMFSLKTGTVMQSSKLGYQTWALAIYLVTTSLKGVSSMKLHRDLEITQKSAWHLAHRLGETRKAVVDPYTGPVEVDETYMGGKRKRTAEGKAEGHDGTRRDRQDRSGWREGPGDQPRQRSRGRRHGRDHAAILHRRPRRLRRQGLHGRARFLREHAVLEHESIRHSDGEYVRGDAGTQGIESFWAMLKRTHTGTFHKISPKHLDRYVTELAGRHNARGRDTVDQMEIMDEGMSGRRLRYPDLVS